MDYENMVSVLEASGDYKVLKRIKPRDYIHAPDGSATKTAIFLDVETTGINALHDEIIELAMVPFRYGPDGRIFEILPPYQSLQEPKSSISAEITRITGIDQRMVTGHNIDWPKVTEFVNQSDIMLAHNAGFDRKFSERYCDLFRHKPWGCSATQIELRHEGYEGTRLAYLVAQSGYFYDGHRTLNDCYAAIEVLGQPLPVSGRYAFAALLANARLVTYRIWANHAPYDLKDHLKRRGYRWSTGENGTPRSWYIDLKEDKLDNELMFLQKEIYNREAQIQVSKIDTFDRFSVRA